MHLRQLSRRDAVQTQGVVLAHLALVNEAQAMQIHSRFVHGFHESLSEVPSRKPLCLLGGIPERQTPSEIWAVSVGAGERNRTLDLRITNALLYRLSYTGEFFNFSTDRFRSSAPSRGFWQGAGPQLILANASPGVTQWLLKPSC
jgi:hypothetical protein